MSRAIAQTMSILAAAVLLVPSSAFPAAEARRPNIVFGIADDLGWGDVAFHGGSAPTPQLDRLAREGLELSQHYVAPVCSPTRAALMTGRCWSRFGGTGPQNQRALPWNTVTLPRALKSVGYEGGTRVPTIVSWPGRVKPGKVHSPVQIIDWMPTLCALASYRPPRDLKWDGLNIASLLTEHRSLADRPLYAVAPG